MPKLPLPSVLRTSLKNVPRLPLPSKPESNIGVMGNRENNPRPFHEGHCRQVKYCKTIGLCTEPELLMFSILAHCPTFSKSQTLMTSSIDVFPVYIIHGSANRKAELECQEIPRRRPGPIQELLRVQFCVTLPRSDPKRAPTFSCSE